MMNLVRRSYESGDEEGIIDLQNTVFALDRRTDLEKWRWQYVQNPCGPAKIFLYETDRKIVGHFALMPVVLKCGDKEVLSGKTENGMMHKKYRGFGNHFVNLVKEGVRESFRDGMGVCWGFAGPMILKPQIAAGFLHVGQVIQLMKVVDGHRFFSEFIRPRMGKGLLKSAMYRAFPFLHKCVNGLFDIKSRKRKGLVIKPVERFDSRFDALWDKTHKKFGITIVRSSSFLNWRFMDNPNAKSQVITAEKDGTLVGYIVLNTLRKENSKIGFIGDLLFEEEGVAGILLDAAIESLKKESVTYISILWVDKGKAYEPLRGVVRRKGFLFKTDVTSMNFVAAFSEEASVREDSADLSNWYITYAFTEGVRF
jgi:hypothetical protein